MDNFEQELQQDFLTEAAQLLADAEQCFLALENSPDDPDLIEKIFRLAHNFKGSGKAVGFSDLSVFTHQLESLLLRIKKKEITISKRTVDLLLRCNDHLQKWVAALKEDTTAKVDSTELAKDIEIELSGESAGAESSTESTGDSAVHEDPPATENAPVTSLADIDAMLGFGPPEAATPVDAAAPPTTDVVSMAPTVDQTVAAPQPLTEPAPPPAATPKKSSTSGGGDDSIRVSLARLEKLLNFVGEMVILHSVLREQAVPVEHGSLRKTVHQLGKLTKEVQEISMSMRMVSLKPTFQKMQRIVRDTSAILGKKINLVLEGEDTEVDKTVLEALGDPLVHLVRNAVDHGIENAERRKAAGKEESGTVILKAYQKSGNLLIEVRDDGGGLDPSILIKKAVEKNIIRADAKLTDTEAYHLIFASGFSTKAEVTEVSGRGVGMDVVRTNIRSLKGEIEIESNLGQGSCFRVRLPLTLAIIDGMLVKVGTERFVIPLHHVHEAIESSEVDINPVTNLGNVMALRGESIPLFQLSTLLGRKDLDPTKRQPVAIVIEQSGRPFAVLVDAIIGQQQVVIKKLGPEHRSMKGLSGSAILGDGRPALILELPELIQNNSPAKPASAVTRRTA